MAWFCAQARQHIRKVAVAGLDFAGRANYMVMSRPCSTTAASIHAGYFRGDLALVSGRIHLHSWLPKQQPTNALLLYIHGLNDYGRRLLPYVHVLNEKKIGVVALDLHGHGKSEGQHGLCASLEDNIADVMQLSSMLSAAAPGTPLYLLGASFGGVIALHASLRLNAHGISPSYSAASHVCNRFMDHIATVRNPSIAWRSSRPISGLILQAPLIQLKNNLEPSEFQRVAAFILSQLFPSTPLVLQRKGSAYHPEVLRDRVVEDAGDAQYYGGPILAGTGAVLLDALKSVEPLLACNAGMSGEVDAGQLEGLSLLRSVPMLLQHGTDDEVCDFAGTAQLYRAAASYGSDVVFKAYDGVHHDLLRERQAVAKRVIGDLITWTEAHLVAAQSGPHLEAELPRATSLSNS